MYCNLERVPERAPVCNSSSKLSFGNQGLAAGITAVGRELDSGVAKEGIVGLVITFAILHLHSISFTMIPLDSLILCVILST